MTSHRHALDRLAEQLRSQRVARFLTQEELATQSGVARVTIARIEGAQTTPRPRTIRALAATLEVSPEDLVEDPAQLWSS